MGIYKPESMRFLNEGSTIPRREVWSEAGFDAQQALDHHPAPNSSILHLFCKPASPKGLSLMKKFGSYKID